jgi:hypothetical protein
MRRIRIRYLAFKFLIPAAVIGNALGLFVIGLRFLITPRSAALFFGLSDDASTYTFHQVIGLRDIWLASIILACLILRDWRMVCVCFGSGVFVCLGDSAIVWSLGGDSFAMWFHAITAVWFGLVSILSWRAFRRSRASAFSPRGRSAVKSHD